MTRGTAAILLAKLCFLLTGYALIIGLGRMFTTEQFGVYGVLFGVVALINMVLIQGSMQTISHFVASTPGGEQAVRRRGFLAQALFLSVFLGVYLPLCPVLARLLHDDSLARYFRLAVLITLTYGFYAINVGYLNGRRLFLRQATLDISFSLTKVSLILFLVHLGYGIEGVIYGFFGAALLVFLLSFAMAGCRFRGGSTELGTKHFIRFAFSVMAVALLLNLLLNTDLLLLKRLSAQTLANTHAGLYTAAQSIARIPYYLLVTASLVMFPTIARLQGDHPSTALRRADASTQALSMVLALLAGMVSIAVPVADRIVLVLFPARYGSAGPALGWLIAGLALMSLLHLAVNMISGGGRPEVSLALLLACLFLQVGAATVLIPRLGVSGAAIATTSAAAMGFLASLAWLWRHFGTRLPSALLLRVLPAAAAVAGLSIAYERSFPGAGSLATVAFLAGSYSFYLLLLALAGALLGMPARSRRVLLVTKPLGPPFNDSSKVLPRGVLKFLDPSSVAVLCTPADLRDSDSPETLERIPVYSSSSSFFGRTTQNLRVFLYLLLNRYRYRALHFFFAPHPTACRAIRLLRRLSPGVPFIQTVMSRPARIENATGLLFGDVITVGSEDTRRRLAKTDPGRELLLVRPGIDPSFDPSGHGRSRIQLGLDPDEFHLLFAGDIEHGGALAHLAAILPRLMEEDPRIHFHFSVRRKHPSTLTLAEDFYAAHLLRYNSRASLYVDHHPFEELLDMQDAMLLPCDHLYAKLDAPLVVLETMARGRPAFLLQRPPLDEIPPADLRPLLLARDDEHLAALILDYVRERAQIPGEALASHVRETFHIAGTASAYETIHARF